MSLLPRFFVVKSIGIPCFTELHICSIFIIIIIFLTQIEGKTLYQQKDELLALLQY